MSLICPWCGAVVTRNQTSCPDCGTLLTGFSAPATPPAPAHVRSPRWLWLILSLPLAVSGLLPVALLGMNAGASVARAQPCRHYEDPQVQAVWVRGKTALRRLMKDPSFRGFKESDIRPSSGNLLTMCGRIHYPLGESAVATRFVSLDGLSRDTALEFRTQNFDVLWNRLCTGAPILNWQYS